MTIDHRRILIVSSTYPRWANDTVPPFVHNLAKDLLGHGWVIDVLAPHAPGAKRTECLDGVNIKRFRYCWPEIAQTVCYGSGALVNLRHQKTNILKVGLLVLFEFLAICRLLATKNYAVLHTHWIIPQGLTGSLACRLFRTPHISSVHGGDIFSLNSRGMRWLKRYALNACQYITANSSATLSATKVLLKEATKISIVPMGTAMDVPAKDSPAVLALRKKYSPANAALVLFVGRLIEEKGVDDLITAMAMLVADTPDIVAVVVGEGHDKVRYERMVKHLGLTKNIMFTGWVDSHLIPRYMAAADLFVGPSISHASGAQEAQGLVFLEAMAARTPVIATNVGGIGDIVIHEQTGLSVNEHAPDEIASAINRLLDDKPCCEKLTTAAFQHVNKHFSRTASVNKFSAIYNALIMSSKHDI